MAEFGLNECGRFRLGRLLFCGILAQGWNCWETTYEVYGHLAVSKADTRVPQLQHPPGTHAGTALVFCSGSLSSARKVQLRSLGTSYFNSCLLDGFSPPLLWQCCNGAALRYALPGDVSCPPRKLGKPRSDERAHLPPCRAVREPASGVGGDLVRKTAR